VKGLPELWCNSLIVYASDDERMFCYVFIFEGLQQGLFKSQGQHQPTDRGQEVGI
jgi:hypothetical protein